MYSQILLLRLTSLDRRFQGPVGARLRKLDIGLRGIILGLYYSFLGDPAGHGERIKDGIGWDGAIRTRPEEPDWYYRNFVKLLGPVMDWAFRNIVAVYREGFTLKYARELKKSLKIPVSSTGGFLHREAMERAIANNDCDMVSLGRALIADPYLYKHMKKGAKGPECNFCNRCLARATLFAVDCYDEKIREEKYRMLAREAE